MKTSVEREKEFRSDLKSVLDKHGAELVARLVEDRGLYSSVTEISMFSKWRCGEITHDYCEFDL